MENKNYLYFINNRNSLYREYGNKFLAIKEEKVIGVYDSLEEALTETLKTEELGTFLVQECVESDEMCINFVQSNVCVGV